MSHDIPWDTLARSSGVDAAIAGFDESGTHPGDACDPAKNFIARDMSKKYSACVEFRFFCARNHVQKFMIFNANLPTGGRKIIDEVFRNSFLRVQNPDPLSKVEAAPRILRAASIICPVAEPCSVQISFNFG